MSTIFLYSDEEIEDGQSAWLAQGCVVGPQTKIWS